MGIINLDNKKSMTSSIVTLSEFVCILQVFNDTGAVSCVTLCLLYAIQNCVTTSNWLDVVATLFCISRYFKHN